MIALLFCMSSLSMQAYHQKLVFQLPVAVIDQDNSRISRTIRTFIESTPEVALHAEEIQDLDEARELLIRGSLAAVVYIPSEFSSKIKKGTKGEILVLIDGANILVAKNVYKALSKSIGVVGAGIQLTMVKKYGVPKDRAMSKVLPVAVYENFMFNPYANYSVYLAPILIFFQLHVFVLIVAISLFVPAQRPDTTTELIGAFQAILFWALLIGLLFFYLYLPAEGIFAQSGFHIVLLALGVFILLDILMAAAIGSLIPSSFLAMEVTVVLGMLSMMLSGLTWPTDMFPPLVRWVSEVIPFTPFARGFRMFLHFPTGLADMSDIYVQFGQQFLVFIFLIGFGAAAKRFLFPRILRSR